MLVGASGCGVEVAEVAEGALGAELEAVERLAAPATPGFDIVIVGGQSNAVGRGRGDPRESAALLSDTALANRVRQLGRWGAHNGELVPVVEGGVALLLEHHSNPNNDPALSAGFAIPFALRLARALPAHRTVVLVPAARGSTSILSWDDTPDGAGCPRSAAEGGAAMEPSSSCAPYPDEQFHLYPDVVARVQALRARPGSHRVLAVLWQQGEADMYGTVRPSHDVFGLMDAARYREELVSLRRRLRADVAPCVPLLIGEPVPSFRPATDAATSSQVLTAFAASRASVAAHDACGSSLVVSASGLLSNADIDAELAPAPPSRDTVHFCARSQRVLGQRYLAALEMVMP